MLITPAPLRSLSLRAMELAFPRVVCGGLILGIPIATTKPYAALRWARGTAASQVPSDHFWIAPA